jgi:hypothetical protein
MVLHSENLLYHHLSIASHHSCYFRRPFRSSRRSFLRLQITRNRCLHCPYICSPYRYVFYSFIFINIIFNFFCTRFIIFFLFYLFVLICLILFAAISFHGKYPHNYFLLLLINVSSALPIGLTCVFIGGNKLLKILFVFD